MVNYLEGVIADIVEHEHYNLSNLKKECPSCDTGPDYALYLMEKHIKEIRSWRASVEISRGPEGRYLEDQSQESQAVEVFLEFLRAIEDP